MDRRLLEPVTARFDQKGIALLSKGIIQSLHISIGIQHQVYKDGTAFAEEGNRIFIIAFAEHRITLDTGHLLHGFVPGDYPVLPIDHKRRIR